MSEAGRPLAGPPTIGVDGEVGILMELLAVERERLTVARRIEEERKIVFPETSVIVRDIERLLGKIRVKEEAVELPVSAEAPVRAKDWSRVSELDALLAEVGRGR